MAEEYTTIIGQLSFFVFGLRSLVLGLCSAYGLSTEPTAPKAKTKT